MSVSEINRPCAIDIYVGTVGSSSIADYAMSYASGSKIEWVSYTSSTTDAPESNGGIAQIIHHSGNIKQVIAFSRSNKIFKKYRYSSAGTYVWSAWAEIT